MPALVITIKSWVTWDIHAEKAVIGCGMCEAFPELLGQVFPLYPLFKISHLEQILDLASLHFPRGFGKCCKD